jgi:hypothetical protein
MGRCGRGGHGHSKVTPGKGTKMLDVIFIAATALFFVIGIFYVRGCERLN